MQINSAAAYSSAVEVPRARGERSGAGTYQAIMKDASGTSPPNGVTGGSGLLSSASAAAVAAQEEDDPYLSVAARHHVEDLVNNPAYAMKEAEKYASNPIGFMMKMPVPENGEEGWVDPKIVQESLDRWNKHSATIRSVHDSAQSLVEQGKRQGKSGAEIYADILRDQLSQSDDYWEARDPDQLTGNLKQKVQSELTALAKAITAAA